MYEKKPLKILHQDVEGTNYLVVIEIYNEMDKYDAIYRVNLPRYFQESKDVFTLYHFVHN